MLLKVHWTKAQQSLVQLVCTEMIAINSPWGCLFRAIVLKVDECLG